MNPHDTEKLGGILERQGYARATGLEDADVILLNTCSIREKAAEKVFSELGRLKGLKRANPDLILGVCGCVAQQEGQSIFARAGHVDFVVGPRAIGSLSETLARIRAGDPGARRQVDTEYRRDSIEFPFDEIRREGECMPAEVVEILRLQERPDGRRRHIADALRTLEYLRVTGALPRLEHVSTRYSRAAVMRYLAPPGSPASESIGPANRDNSAS